MILLYPLEWFMEVLLTAAYAVTGSYGFSIILLSIVVNAMLLPLYRLAEQWQSAEKRARALMQPDLDKIRAVYTGQERFFYIRTVYRMHRYNPWGALRASLGPLVQIPFFLAAYAFLLNFPPFRTTSFGVIDLLAAPDRLLDVGHVLPVLMTAVNLATLYVQRASLSSRERLQALVLSGIFLLLLYSAPAALLLYWTTNNAFALGRALLARLLATPLAPGPDLSGNAQGRLEKALESCFGRLQEFLRVHFGLPTVVSIALALLCLAAAASLRLEYLAGKARPVGLLSLSLVAALAATMIYYQNLLPRLSFSRGAVAVAVLGLGAMGYALWTLTGLVGVPPPAWANALGWGLGLLFSAVAAAAVHEAVHHHRQPEPEDGSSSAVDWPVAALAGLFAGMFLSSINMGMVTSMGDLALTLVAFAAVGVLAHAVTSAVWGGQLGGQTLRLSIVLTLLYCFQATLLHTGLFVAGEGFANLIRGLFFAALAVSVARLVFRARRALIAAVLLMSGAALVQLVLAGPPTIPKSLPIAPQVVQAVFKKTPHIYYIVPDSYANLSTVERLGIDISNFSGELQDTGFTLYPDYFASYHQTLESVSSSLDMAHHDGVIRGRGELPGTRGVISGRNNLNRILHRNGYATAAIHDRLYVFAHTTCHWGECWPRSQIPQMLINTILPPAVVSLVEPARVHADFLARFKNRLAVVEQSTTPTFTYLHAHLPDHTHNRGRCDTAKQTRYYAQRIRRANAWLIGVVRDILRVDVNALVIIASDHGGYVTNDCTTLRRLPSTFFPVQDRLGAFLAIRWGGTVAGSAPEIRTSARLFSTIVAQLAEDPRLLRQAPADSAFLPIGKDVYQAIEGGKPLWPLRKHPPPRR